jgi:hypothetical protein
VVAPLPAAGRAAVSPSGLILAGAGVGLGLVAHLPLLIAAALGATFWGVRVGVASARAAARRRRGQRSEPIDPYAVPDPWRRFVRESLTAQTKFDQAVARCPPGPMRERLEMVSRRVHDGVRECWRVAHLGAALDAALAGLDPKATSLEMRRLQDTFRPYGEAAPGSMAETRDQTEAALAAQLQAAHRVEAAAQRATDRLRLLTADLNAAVASAVELSLDASDPASAGALADNVDTVVGELESLRQALEETTSGRPATGSAEAR